MHNKRLLLTCEHAGNRVPSKYLHLFEYDNEVLDTHRGYDIGAQNIALKMAVELETQFISYHYTRLLIEPNRTIAALDLFSQYSINLSDDEKGRLLKEYHNPYQQLVEDNARKIINDSGHVVHVGIHTFTPELNGIVRDGDIGVLFDPERRQEAMFANLWLKELGCTFPDFISRPNYPYLGTDDGLTTRLRTLFPSSQYLGFELEVKNTLMHPSNGDTTDLIKNLAQSLNSAIQGFEKIYK